MVIDAGPGHQYKMGDVLYALPVHICPTVAMYNHANVVESGEIGRKMENYFKGKGDKCLTTIAEYSMPQASLSTQTPICSFLKPNL
ncbi:hypothetical protein [Daejeonella sp.]|uniref:hypothetical protein n=1 Tax=Daejeonella sp. TaxID=2805397 RepID=UPI0030C14119